MRGKFRNDRGKEGKHLEADQDGLDATHRALESNQDRIFMQSANTAKGPINLCLSPVGIFKYYFA